MTFVDQMSNNDWSDADMDNRTRATVASVVSEARQQELQTIMIGHIAGMRVASAKELGEITLVKTTTEAAGQTLIQARLDIALLRETWGLERAKKRLSQPAVKLLMSAPAPGVPAVAMNQPAVDTDLAERTAAQATVTAASMAAKALADKRAPPPTPAAPPTAAPTPAPIPVP